MSLTESDKVVLTKYPPLPSKCAVCLRDSNGELGFVDFQLSLDYHGAVVICVDCMVNVAEVLGYVDVAEVEVLKAQVGSLVESNRELQENNERLNASLDNLLNLRPVFVSSDLSSDAVESETATDSDFQLELDLE